MPVITLDHVTKSFGNTVVIREFSQEIRDGEFITLLGPSGCGKTTTLRMIAGFEKPTGGAIRIDGKLVSGEGTFVPPEERGVGMVFQSYAVWPHMNVFDNVAYPLKIQGRSQKDIEEKVGKVLDTMHLSEYAKRMPSELSGGQQQRVALGRALASEAGILLLDEPLSNLDAKLREEMRFEIKEIQKKLGITVIYVTHDQTEAMAMSDRIFVFNDGVVQQVGGPVDIYRHPANTFVADFVGRINLLRGESKDGKVILEGIEDVLPYDGDLTGTVDVVIRPENIRVVQGDAHLNGTLVSEYYMGDINDCRVKVGEQELRVIADADTYRTFRIGDRIGLEIKEFLVLPHEKND